MPGLMKTGRKWRSRKCYRRSAITAALVRPQGHRPVKGSKSRLGFENVEVDPTRTLRLVAAVAA
jgi:hypothetical protein